MNILQGKHIEEEVVGGDSVGGNIAYLLQDISFLYHKQYTHTLFFSLFQVQAVGHIAKKWCFLP